jgi:hypothetical protein
LTASEQYWVVFDILYADLGTVMAIVEPVPNAIVRLNLKLNTFDVPAFVDDEVTIKLLIVDTTRLEIPP